MVREYVTVGNNSSKDSHTRVDGSVSSSSERTPLPADFQLLYASRDGKLCLFETGEGHLSAVSADKFA